MDGVALAITLTVLVLILALTLAGNFRVDSLANYLVDTAKETREVEAEIKLAIVGVNAELRLVRADIATLHAKAEKAGLFTSGVEPIPMTHRPTISGEPSPFLATFQGSKRSGQSPTASASADTVTNATKPSEP